MPDLLRIRSLVAGYGRSAVLHGVDLDIELGGRVTVLGPNGAGKTTLLRIISGLLRPRAGSVQLEGEEIGGLSAAEVVRRGVVHVPEGRRVFPDFTVRDNLRAAAYLSGGRLADGVLERILDVFPPLRPHLDHRAGLLSGGEQQMVALSRAVVQGPRLLLLDEVSLGLAPIITKEIYGRLDVLFGDTSMLIVEQNPQIALNHCTYAVFMRNGSIQARGRPGDFEEKEVLAAAYLGSVDGHS